MLNNRSTSSNSSTNSLALSHTTHTRQPTESPETSSSTHSHPTNLSSSVLQTVSYSPTTTDRTSLLPIDQLSPISNHHHKRTQTTLSQSSSQQSSILFGTPQSTDRSELPQSDMSSQTTQSAGSSRQRLPSFNFTPDDESIEELLRTLGYNPAQSRANSLVSRNQPPDRTGTTESQSRQSMVMLDIDGREFSIHEHSLSPVSERTELDTQSSKTNNSKPRPLVQSVLSQRFQSGIQSTAPLTLSPKPNHLSTPSSPRPSSTSSLPAISQEIDHQNQFSQPTHQNRPTSLGTHPANSFNPLDTNSNYLLASPPAPGNNNLGHPSLNRLPKKTSQLIQLFENTNNLPPSHIPTFTPPNKLQPNNRIQSSPNSNSQPKNHLRQKSPQVPGSPTQTRQPSISYLTDNRTGRSNSPQIKASVSHSPVAGSIESFNSPALPGPSMTEQECLRLRKERRERIAMASKNHAAVASASRLKVDSHPVHLEPPSPMSDQHLKHRKSVASSITSRISDVQVLHSGSIWYRNPQTNQWRQTRGILTTEAVYLMNENGEVDRNLPDQSIELKLSGCTSVESVRSKRSYGPDFHEPHLHILRIAWAEFDPRSNSRAEYEEFLGCSRATQRADWVGAIWQAAHDLGGFVDQPDIPLRGHPSPKSPLNNQLASNPATPETRQPIIATPTLLPQQECSPRLDPISLVDRAVSVGPVEARQLPHSSPSQLQPPPASAVSSRTSEASTGTTNLQSELDRDLATNLQLHSPAFRLYSEQSPHRVQDNYIEISQVDPAFRDCPIDPNLGQNYIRTRSPELDIFAMLDRMSVKGSIHRNTAEFYDPPKSDSLKPQQAQDMHVPQPISTTGQANIAALEDTADRSHRSISRHSYHTIRPTSATGVHEHLLDSPRSSAVGSRSSQRERLSEVRSTSQSTHTSQNGHLTVTPTVMNQRPPSSSPRMTPKPRTNEVIHEPTSAQQKRGAWSDTDRLSNQTDNILSGSNPARAVQRDLRRILKTMERNDSYRAAESDSLGHCLDSIQNQLQNVATKLRGHQVEREPNYPVKESDEPTIADKVDYMLSLCNVLLESQHKVSSAVEKNLQAHGVSISNRSAHTRSMRSNTNPSRRSSHVPTEPGMPGPAPLTPQPEGSLDTDQIPPTDRLDSPPLPPLPEANGGEETIPNAHEDHTESPTELPPPVAIQEAGLGRIENLLVELLSRVDESAQRQHQEPSPPAPDKDLGDGRSTRSRSSRVATGSQSGTLDLDADVALWKSRGNGISTGDPSGPWYNDQIHRFGQSVTSHANSIYPPTEAETPSSSDQPNPQMIPDYNLAYEAEDQVARRIADERARAARRLEGVSTPFSYRQSIGQGYPIPVKPRVPSHLSQPDPTVPPNQDQQADDPHLHSSQNDPRLSRPDLEQSHWSSTTPTAEEQDDSAPPPPPKDDQFVAPPPSQAALSVRTPSRVPSRAISHQSAARSISVGSNPPAPVPAPPPVSAEELRNVVNEALQHHSTEQAPVLDEVVTLLRNQDQVNQASVLNQAEVSRYLTQLNTHLEGVLHKKNDEILQIGDNVGRLEKQLAVLLEQSEQISSVIPLMKSAVSTSAPPPEQAPTTIDKPDEAFSRNLDAVSAVVPQMDVDHGPDGPVDVSVHPHEDDVLDPPQENGEPHVTLMSKKPSVGYRITGPRARKISFNKGLKGPRMPSGLVGKLWGGPVPAADWASRWGTAAGGSLKRVPTKSSHVSENPANVEAALSAVNPDDPVGQEALSQMDNIDDDRAGTIALGVSHILKFLRENTEKEELRRQKKEEEKAAKPQPAIPDEMEQRRAKIEELQLRREATLAEDKAKQMEAMMQAMKQQAAEHDRLLKKIAEELEAKNPQLNPEVEEEERKKRHEDVMADVNNVLTTVESGVMAHLEDFKAQMLNEMKQTFEKVGELREQKQQIQADIADMLSYMSKVRGGGPDPRWQYPSPVPSLSGGPEGSTIGGPTGAPVGPYAHLSPIRESYPSPHTDLPERDGTEIGAARSVVGFGPRSPGRR